MAKKELTFHEFAEKKQLDNNYYPHAKAGPKTLSLVCWFVLWVFLGWVGYFLSAFAADYFASELDGAVVATPIDAATKNPLIAIFFKAFKLPAFDFNLLMANLTQSIAENALKLAWILTFVLVFFIGKYLIQVVLRQKSWERDVLKSDRAANSLKRRLINSLEVAEKISNIKKRYRGKDQSEMSFEDKNMLAALKDIKKMKVFVNVRQSLDDDTIERQCRIIMKAPVKAKENECLQGLLKGFENEATRSEEGEFTFGSQIISADHKTIMYVDRKIVPDKYRYDIDEEETQEEANNYSEYVYPPNLYADHTEENIRITKLAKRWTEAAAEDVDAMLATMNIGATRLDYNLGSKSCKVSYSIAFRMDGHDSSERMAEQLDKRFNTSGSTVDYMGNRMAVMIPLPEQCQTKADVKSLIIGAFGEPDPQQTRKETASAK